MTDEEIYHHGILGMQWGKRNGPPYPLGSEQHSSREKQKKPSPNSSNARESSNVRRKKQTSNVVRKKSSEKPSLSRREKKSEDKAKKKTESSKSTFKKSLSHEEIKKVNRELLAKNPNAAVINWDAVEKKSGQKLYEQQKRQEAAAKFLAGAGVLALGAGALYLGKTKAGQKIVKEYLGKRALNKEVDAIFEAEKSFAFNEGSVRSKEINALFAKGDFDHFVNSWIGKQESKYISITEKEYRALSDKDIVLPKGQEFHRISKVAEKDVRNCAFVSFDPDDVNRYTAFLPGMWNVNTLRPPISPVYKISMEGLTEIKSPSAKKRVDILADLIEKDDAVRRALASDVSGGATMSSHDLALLKYKEVSRNLIDRNNETSKRYVEAVKKQGYNVIVDDNDALNLSRSPLIVLDNKIMGNVRSRQLTARDIANAASNVKHQDYDLPKNEILGVDKDFAAKMYADAARQVATAQQASAPVSKSTIIKIKELKAAGKSDAEIAAAAGVKIETVRRII